MAKKRKTWICGDCGAEYPMTIESCQRPWLDFAFLRTRTAYSNTPLYFDTVVALQFCPAPPREYR